MADHALDRTNPATWPEYMTAAEAGSVLLLGKRAVQKYCTAGRIAFVQVGRRRLIRKGALLRYLERSEVREVVVSH